MHFFCLTTNNEDYFHRNSFNFKTDTPCGIISYRQNKPEQPDNYFYSTAADHTLSGKTVSSLRVLTSVAGLARTVDRGSQPASLLMRRLLFLRSGDTTFLECKPEPVEQHMQT